MDYVSFEDLAAKDGVTVVATVRIGDYQGELFSILARGNERGLCQFSYGSCSGCDWIEGVQGNPKGIAEVVEAIKAATFWHESESALREWFVSRDWNPVTAGMSAKEKGELMGFLAATPWADA